MCENETEKNKGHVYFYMSARRQLRHATFPKVLKLLGKGAQNKVFLQAGMSDSIGLLIGQRLEQISSGFFLPDRWKFKSHLMRNLAPQKSVHLTDDLKFFSEFFFLEKLLS